MWSEKVKSELKAKLKDDDFKIEGERIRQILDSYQIASGHNTGVGQILALKESILEGQNIEIINWGWDKNIIITNIEQLRGFIQSFDPAIDIIANDDLK